MRRRQSSKTNDRIEVISGPGGTLWGGNAVNGVINIITKDSIGTRGWFVEARTGTLDDRLSVRTGGSFGDTGSYRVYGLGMRHGSMVRANGDSVGDSWKHVQGGFRTDWRNNSDTLTVQGDAYRGTGIGLPAALSSGRISGSNLSGRWERQIAGGSSVHVQAYADTAYRLLVSGIHARVNQYSLESQYNFAPRTLHTIVIGGGYRRTDDRLEPGPGTVFLNPAQRTLGFANLFVQDAIALSDRVRLTAGIKLEHNSYTGLELMPDVRMAWSVSPSTVLWTSVARGVRTPSRFDTDIVNQGVLTGNPDFVSEELIAYEAGYRSVLTPDLSFSVSAFYNSYDGLRTIEASGPAVFPLVVENNMEGHTTGLEAWGDYSVREWWRLSAGFAALRKDLRLSPGSRDVLGVGFAGNDPRYQWSLRSGLDLSRRVVIDLALRGVGRLESPAVDAYVEADARIAWRATDRLILSLDGQNLLHEHHVEFINPSIAPSEVPRSLTVTARWEP